MDRPEGTEPASGARSLLLLDACCVINLLASGEARAILGALEGADIDVGVTRLVAEQEVLNVSSAAGEEEGDAAVDPERPKSTLMLQPFVDEGLVRVLVPEGEREVGTYVDLALQLDDGEAMTGAIAIHRGGEVATDDRKAIRVLGAQSRAPAVRRTSWLVRRWAQSADVGRKRLRSALLAVERRGSFLPPPDDPLRSWWWSVTGRS